MIEALAREVYARERALGAAMTLEDTIELARSLADPTRDAAVVES